MSGEGRVSSPLCPCCGRYPLMQPGDAMCMGCVQYGCGDIDAVPCQHPKSERVQP